MLKRLLTHLSARHMGKLSGKARAERARRSVRETAVRIREELGLPPDQRLA